MSFIPVAAIAVTPIVVIDEDLIEQSKLQARIRAEGELKIVASEKAKLNEAEHAVLAARRRVAEIEAEGARAVASIQTKAARDEAERREAEWVRDNPHEARIREEKRLIDAEEAQRASDRATGNVLRVVAGAAVGAVVGFAVGM